MIKGDGVETFMLQNWVCTDFPNSPQCASIRGRNGSSGRVALYDFINRYARWRRQGRRLEDQDLDFFFMIVKLWEAWWKQNFDLKERPPLPHNIVARNKQLIAKRRKHYATSNHKRQDSVSRSLGR